MRITDWRVRVGEFRTSDPLEARFRRRIPAIEASGDQVLTSSPGLRSARSERLRKACLFRKLVG
eukprot:15471183-Alexandrium_andersonii.AAC.1